MLLACVKAGGKSFHFFPCLSKNKERDIVNDTRSFNSGMKTIPSFQSFEERCFYYVCVVTTARSLNTTYCHIYHGSLPTHLSESLINCYSPRPRKNIILVFFEESNSLDFD
jgi:hypothetical protein